MAAMDTPATTRSNTSIVTFDATGSQRVQRRYKCEKLRHIFSGLQGRRKRSWKPWKRAKPKFKTATVRYDRPASLRRMECLYCPESSVSGQLQIRHRLGISSSTHHREEASVLSTCADMENTTSLALKSVIWHFWSSSQCSDNLRTAT
jgi:hypothetical protein